MQARTKIVQGGLGLLGVLVASSAAAQNGGASEPGTREAALPAVAAASPSGRFGLKGQLAVSSDAGLSISHSSVSGADGSTTELVLRPAVDYFVIENLSIGGFLGLDYIKTSGGSTTAFSIGPRVGYNLPFSERWSVWPKVGFSFASTSVKTDSTTTAGVVTPSTSTSNSAVALNLFVPLMFHPVEHFFLGFGPALDTDLSGDAKATVIAGRLTIGGWL
jgi:hypothetical protein